MLDCAWRSSTIGNTTLTNKTIMIRYFCAVETSRLRFGEMVVFPKFIQLWHAPLMGHVLGFFCSHWSIICWVMTLFSFHENCRWQSESSQSQQFYTKDARDNDSVSHNCIHAYNRVWWYNRNYSLQSNVNSIYHRGNYSEFANSSEKIEWITWRGRLYSLKWKKL